MIELMRERIMIQKSSTKKDGTGNHDIMVMVLLQFI